jgi:O-antigen/teichoic acid export membrane protein
MRGTLLRIVHWAGTFARMDMKYAMTGGFLLSITQVTSALFGIALTIAFANLLSPEVYGTYKYVLATYALVGIAALPGLETALLQAMSRGFDRSFLKGLAIKIRWGFLGTAASFCYAAYHWSRGEDTIGVLFIIVGIALPLMETLGLYTTYLNGKKKYGLWTIVEVSIQACSTATLLTTMYFTSNLVALMIAYFLPYITVRGIVTVSISRRISQNAESDEGVLQYSKSLTIFHVLSRLIGSADQIVLFHLLGPVSVAVYSLATAVPMRMQGLFRITGTLAFPKFAARSGAEIARALPRKMLLFGCAIFGMCAAYVFIAPALFTYVFPRYAPAIPYSQMAVFYTLSAVTYPFSSYLFSHKKLRANYIMAVASFVLKALCLAIFVPLYGLWGAMIGLLATSVLTITLSLYFLYQARNDTESVSVVEESIRE